MKLKFIFLFGLISTSVLCQIDDTTVSIIKSGGKFYFNGKNIRRNEVNKILKTDKIALENYKIGSAISILGGCVITGTMLYVGTSAVKSLSAIAAGGYSRNNQNEFAFNPNGAILIGSALVFSGIVVKRSAWRVYNKKNKNKEKLNINPIIDSKKVGFEFNF
jgi:hypothetical protein